MFLKNGPVAHRGARINPPPGSVADEPKSLEKASFSAAICGKHVSSGTASVFHLSFPCSGIAAARILPVIGEFIVSTANL